MAHSYIHFEELLARTENDRELVRELLSIFKEEFPQRCQALREAVEAHDASRVVLEAHALKGMLFNLAAGEAAEAVAHLERLGRSKETGKFRETFLLFEILVKELSGQLEACMAEVSG